MKKHLIICTVFVLIFLALCGCMSENEGGSSSGDNSQSSKNQSSSEAVDEENSLGNYIININSCRLAKDYEGKEIVIVNYNFKNKSEESTSFNLAINDKVYQNDVGLNKCYVADDSANYTDENQKKDIKKGANLTVEVAYYLNDKETDIEVECSELISLENKKVTKTLSIK